MVDDEAPQTPDPSAPTVTQQVTPRTEVVDRSVEALESVRDEVLQLTEAELPGVTGLHAAFVDAESNRVVVQTPDAGSALITALGERYGTDTVAVHPLRASRRSSRWTGTPTPPRTTEAPESSPT